MTTVLDVKKYLEVVRLSVSTYTPPDAEVPSIGDLQEDLTYTLDPQFPIGLIMLCIQNIRN